MFVSPLYILSFLVLYVEIFPVWYNAVSDGDVSVVPNRVCTNCFFRLLRAKSLAANAGRTLRRLGVIIGTVAIMTVASAGDGLRVCA